MVITILEAKVESDKQSILKTAYSKAVANLDEGIVETFLVSDALDNDVWRIMTVWKDREALSAMRFSGEIPKGVLIFKEAGVEPILTLLGVAAYAHA
jgi:quinol monooxygenase YgiN